jgi:hypothetical protein
MHTRDMTITATPDWVGATKATKAARSSRCAISMLSHQWYRMENAPPRALWTPANSAMGHDQALLRCKSPQVRQGVQQSGPRTRVCAPECESVPCAYAWYVPHFTSTASRARALGGTCGAACTQVLAQVDSRGTARGIATSTAIATTSGSCQPHRWHCLVP